MGTRRKSAPVPDGTMSCPDCRGSGREVNSYGDWKFQTVKHNEDQCPDPDIHWVREDSNGTTISHRHYVRCRRCAGAGRVKSTERFLAEIILVLKAASWK